MMRKRIQEIVAALGLAVAAGGLEAASLDECIRAALENSPDVQAAARRVEAADAAIGQALSAYYPQVAASGVYGRTDNPPQAFFMQLNQHQASMEKDFNNPEDTENYRGSLGAKWRLYDGGRRGLMKQMAQAGAEAASSGKAALQNELIYQVTRGYYGILQAQAFLEVQRESVTSIGENLRVAGERFKAGAAVKVDVLNLEVQLAQAEEDSIRASNNIQRAVAALNTAIGEDLVGPEGLPEEPMSAKVAKPPAGAEDGYEGRPELEAARKMLEAQSLGVRNAKGDYIPTLSAVGSLDWDTDGSISPEHSYFAGVMAEWDLFTGFRRGAVVRETKARQAAAEADLRKAENQLKMDLTMAGLQANEAFERHGVVRRTVESAKEALRITREQYSQGSADVTILLTSQVGLTATQSRLVASYYDYLIALSNLSRAQGELIEEYEKYR